MRRLLIIFYWLLKSRNNVSLKELISFVTKPKVRAIAEKFITTIEPFPSWYKIQFNTMPQPLYWPKAYSIDGIYQVVTETFDHHDWHFYQKEKTEISTGEVLLDVGAAEGLFALSVINKCERIIMVEPNDSFYASLQESFKPYVHKVQLMNVAVGSKEGEIIFNESSLSGRVDENNTTGTVKKITTIDKLISPGIKITYLKADLEGHELEMLKGAKNTIQSNKPKIAITTYHTENDANEIISLVLSFVPEYRHYVKGVFHEKGKPVMIHFWVAK